ncbi:MAG: anti-sigma factor domain-containing protein [Chthoniobacterales bacterium]
MIAEELQDQAALYALELLRGEEATSFDRELARNPELQTFVRDLRDAAGALTLTRRQVEPPASLKNRVLQKIAAEAGATRAPETTPSNVIPFRNFIPWAIAAALAIFCGVLALDRAKLEQRLTAERAERTVEPVLIALAPSADGPAKAEAVVAWEPDRQTGVIKIRNLPAANAGKDYQLWAVDAGHTDPVNAGIIRIGADGVAQVRFKPDQPAREVKAFALSLERVGGVPKKEGPILLVGTT